MMKEIVTSCYAEARELQKEGYMLVSVSRGTPGWFRGCYKLSDVAPTWAMVKMTSAEKYDEAYRKILDSLDAKKIYESLPEKCALLCYEKYPDWCHRRMLAEWMEEEIGIEITEFGLKREAVVAYDDMNGHDKKNVEQLQMIW